MVFSEQETLAKTAAQLNITQPTVTRGLQKLEADLGVKLFNRQPNKLVLTKTGRLAVKEAKNLLAANKNFVAHIKNYDQVQQTITIASTAPGPIVIADLLAKQFNLKVDHSLLNPAKITNAIENVKYSFCFSNQEIQNDKVESLFIGKENLYINLDQFMFLANKRQVSFKDLRGLSFVVLNDIGPWKQIIQDKIPDAKFLYQAEREALTEITRFSNFPYFSTNVTHYESIADTDNQDRVKIPIIDQAASMDFYVSYLKTQRHRLQPVFQRLLELWPTEKAAN